MTQVSTDIYDAIIVGSGVSGSFVAMELTKAGYRCLMLEAGHHFTNATYPKNELDANAQLFWSGGIELNTQANLAFLRPKVVGGGSVTNQALLDRLDEIALTDFRDESGISFFTPETLAPWFEKAESHVEMHEVPREYWNENCHIFERGFHENGYRCAPLTRAQGDCRYAEGTDCIRCLWGCPLGSKQSMPVTVLKSALGNGLELISGFEASKVTPGDSVAVSGKFRNGEAASFVGKQLVLAAGAIGNTILLQRSAFPHENIGKRFYTHPQEMILGVYDREILAFKGGFQALKSDDKNFRQQGFKLENIFAPPASLSMLLPHRRQQHLEMMKRLRHLACIEVAVRDTNPGTVRIKRNGKVIVKKTLNHEDKRRKRLGSEAIHKIFRSTGAREVIDGQISIGLHLMGGCAIGTNPSRDVVSPEFKLYGHDNIFVADSSIFPNAPGQNPSLTIMALSLQAAEVIKNERAIQAS